MRFLAAAVHYAVEVTVLIAMALVAIIVWPIVAIYRLIRWAELQVVYGGDKQARDKDRWRGD